MYCLSPVMATSTRDSPGGATLASMPNLKPSAESSSRSSVMEPEVSIKNMYPTLVRLDSGAAGASPPEAALSRKSAIISKATKSVPPALAGRHVRWGFRDMLRRMAVPSLHGSLHPRGFEVDEDRSW